MEIVLRKMTKQEYKKFLAYSIENHTKELMQQLGFSFRKARSETKSEIRRMLPAGIKTKDNYLMVIEDPFGNNTVGFIWYVFETVDEIRQCFLCDFVIDEAERRKGYAKNALNQMESSAKAYGCQECALFVNNGNVSAKNLYSNCGYVTSEESGYGMFMKKSL